MVLQIRTTRSPGKHRKVRVQSSPLKNPGFLMVFRISAKFLWLSCLSMHVHACRCCVVLCATLPLVSRPVSRQSRPRTLVFPGETCCFVVEVQDSNQLSSNRSRILCQNRDVWNARVVLRYRMLRPKQPITPSVDCSASKCLISLNFGSRLACLIGCIGVVYRV